MKQKFYKPITAYITKHPLYNLINHNHSYSQEGEDMILRALFEDELPKGYRGFYVDVGAYDPVRFSNTYYFYKRGWCGLNIEPTPLGYKRLKKWRPRDISLNYAVSDESGARTFYRYTEHGVNSLYDGEINGYKKLQPITVPTTRLEYILASHNVEHIDFMNIDCEGNDHKVILSNNWDKFRPVFVLVEDKERKMNDIKRSMIANGYEVVGMTKRTTIYKDQKWKHW